MNKNSKVRFIQLSEEHLEQVLKWRTSDYVNQFMYTDVQYDPYQHREWFRKFSEDPSQKWWVIKFKAEKVGVISLQKLGVNQGRCLWSYYLGEEKFFRIGAFIPPFLYNHVFSHYAVDIIEAEVMAENVKVIQIHLSHGYRLIKTVDQHVFKNDRWHAVQFLELTREAWYAQRAQFAAYEADFE